MRTPNSPSACWLTCSLDISCQTHPHSRDREMRVWDPCVRTSYNCNCETFPVGQTRSQAEQGCDLGQWSSPFCSSTATSVNENNSFTAWLGNLMEKKYQSYSWNFGYQIFPVSIRYYYFFFILTTTLSDQYNDPTLWFRTLRTRTRRVTSKADSSEKVVDLGFKARPVQYPGLCF